ncbi:MAG: MFS transporter [Lachnospiraceae bacterium]|nr:MFS transporter [Lachnospiraceae bacterium]
MKQKVYPWLIVLCCCGQAAAFLGFTNNCSGVFFAHVAEELQTGIGNISFYLTIINLLTGFLAPTAVKLFGRLDARLLVLIAASASALGYFGMSRASSVWQIYLAACIIGVAGAFYGTAIISLFIGRWFHSRMGLVMGFTFCASGLMGAVMSPFFNSVIESAGWRTGYLYGAIFVFVTLLPSAMLLHLLPSRLGLTAYGHVTEPKASSPTASSEPSASSANASDSPASGAPWRKMLLLACLINFAAYFIMGISTHISNYAVTIGLTTQMGAYLISSIMVGNTLSKLLAGFLCDAISPKRTCALSTALVAVGLALLVLFGNSGSGSFFALALGGVLTGITYSVGTVTLSTYVKQIFGLERSGVVYAKVSAVGSVSSAIAYTAIGVSFDLFGSYAPAILFCMALSLIALLCVFGISACEARLQRQ